MSLRDNIFITKQLRINSYRQKMAVSVIVDLSRAPHGSYCTFSDTLGNSINRPVLPLHLTKRKEESLVSTSTLHFSGAVVTLRRALKIAKEFASSGGSRVLGKSKVILKSASSLSPAGSGDLRGVARGMHYFTTWKCPLTGNRCRIA